MPSPYKRLPKAVEDCSRVFPYHRDTWGCATLDKQRTLDLGYNYDLAKAPTNVDYHVYDDLKVFDKEVTPQFEIRHSIKGYTRITDPKIGLESLRRFLLARPNDYKEVERNFNSLVATQHYQTRDSNYTYDKYSGVKSYRGYQFSSAKALDSQLKYGPVKNMRFEAVLKQAMKNVEEQFLPTHKVPVLTHALASYTLNMRASAGYSFPGRKVGEVIDAVEARSRFIFHMIGDPKTDGCQSMYRPYLLALRGHLSEINTTGEWYERQKVRNIWNSDSPTRILENMFLAPLMEEFTHNPPSMLAFGKDAMSELRNQLSDPVPPGWIEGNTDISQFDANMHNWVLVCAFEILEKCFDFSLKICRGERVLKQKLSKASKYKKLWDSVVEHFLHGSIMLPDGRILKKHGKVASGTGFTQIIDSLANAILREISKVSHDTVSTDKFLGDDNNFQQLLSEYEKLTLNHITAFYSDIYRVPVKLSKCNVVYSSDHDQGIRDRAEMVHMISISANKVREKAVSRNPKLEQRMPQAFLPTLIDIHQTGRTFLGYRFDNGLLVRPDHEWFCRAIYHERHTATVAHAASRLLGLLLVGGVNSELFLKFCYWWWDRHPELETMHIPVSKQAVRLARYVFHIDANLMKIPTIRKLDVEVAKRFLWTGERPWNPD